MKTTDKLKQEIYREVQNSGFLKNVQSQIKAHVYDLIQKQSQSNRQKIGFQYEHPLLSKLRKYPITSLCMDLIQQFLQSFKFKHTLNVFKKEINRSFVINRSSLAQQFRIEIKNPESQAVLLSLVSQLVSGDISTIKSHLKQTTNTNTIPNKGVPPPRSNNFINEVKPETENKSNSNSIHNTSSSRPLESKSNISEPSKIDSSSKSKPNTESADLSINSSSAPQVKEEKKEEKKQQKNEKGKKKKEAQKQKPPEGASDLLLGVIDKFSKTFVKPEDKEKEKLKLFESKRAFSEEKEKKVIDPNEGGTNKIRGISAGKSSPFMNKFFNPQPPVQQKNQSYIQEQLDEFQQSKDSTRKNPLFSSSQSGFDKSGFDQSVDSNAIKDYEYSQRAKKFTKKY